MNMVDNQITKERAALFPKVMTRELKVDMELKLTSVSRKSVDEVPDYILHINNNTATFSPDVSKNSEAKEIVLDIQENNSEYVVFTERNTGYRV